MFLNDTTSESRTDIAYLFGKKFSSVYQEENLQNTIIAFEYDENFNSIVQEVPFILRQPNIFFKDEISKKVSDRNCGVTSMASYGNIFMITVYWSLSHSVTVGLLQF